MRANWGTVDARLEPTLTLLGALLKRDEVIEVRVVETTYRNGAATGKLIANGYFNDPLQLAAAATRWDGKADLYLVVNPVRRDLLYAAANQLRCPPVWTATARDIIRRSAFIVNLETQGDLIGYHQALELAEAIRTDLKD